jgi:membrane protease YdiL (CAAX protease family)
MNSLTLEPSLVLNTLETPVAAEPAATPKPRKPRVWTAFAILILATLVGNIAIIFAFVSAGIVIGVVMGAQGVDSATIQTSVQEFVSQPLPALLLSLFPFQLTLTAFVLFAAWRSPEPFQQRLGLLPQSGRTIGGLKLTTMAAFTISTAFAVNFAMYYLMGPPGEDAISAAINDGSWWTITLLSVLLSVIPALVEETLFRGYMQRRFLRRWSPAVAITVSTLLFAIMHMDSIQHIIAVIPLGAVTGLLAWRTNSVKPGMLVHGVHNVAAVSVGGLATVLIPLVGDETFSTLILASIPVMTLIGLPAVVSLLRGSKPQPVVDATLMLEPVVESLSVLKRELALPEFATDSRLASQAV